MDSKKKGKQFISLSISSSHNYILYVQAIFWHSLAIYEYNCFSCHVNRGSYDKLCRPPHSVQLLYMSRPGRAHSARQVGITTNCDDLTMVVLPSYSRYLQSIYEPNKKIFGRARTLHCRRRFRDCNSLLCAAKEFMEKRTHVYNDVFCFFFVGAVA